MEGLSIREMRKHFPYDQMRGNQEAVLARLNKEEKGLLAQMPTGEGKTGCGVAVASAFSAKGLNPVFYITPSKPQVNQIAENFEDRVAVIYGKNEYTCLYYQERGKPNVSADESPCYMLDCPHRVNQDTGQTADPKASPCPYYLAKFQVLKESQAGKIIVCTTAFYLVNRLMVGRWKELEPELLVIDEVHNIAKICRRMFEYKLTSTYLYRVINILDELDKRHSVKLKKFVDRFYGLCKQKARHTKKLLEEDDIRQLIDWLTDISIPDMEKRIHEYIRSGKLDPVEDFQTLKHLENLVLKIPKMLRSLRFAISDKNRHPLSYVIAFYYKDEDDEGKERFHLTLRSYYVAPLIKSVLGKKNFAYSATINDPFILKSETGIDLPFMSLASSFDIANTRIFLPRNTPNLSLKKQRRNDLQKSLKMIISAAKRFAAKGKRSLVVVISDMEREKFLKLADNEGLNAISYGNGVKPKVAAQKFKDGEGDVLVGTAANYAEGLDLPAGIAPVIFFLRPGYAPPDDPESQFEERRFSNGQVWALRNWRVSVQALQVRGRNIRDAGDLGVCFFISQSFRNFLFGSLPDWLKKAYKGEVKMEDAVNEALKLL